MYWKMAWPFQFALLNFVIIYHHLGECSNFEQYLVLSLLLMSRKKWTMEEKVRNSNLELFRIVAMLAIVAHHYVVNSGLMSPTAIFSDIGNWRSLFLLEFGAWGKTGINCFMLITGYFMCTSNISIRKYVKLIAQVYVIKIGVFVALLLAGYESVSLMGVVKLLMPIWSIDKNFLGCFLAFFLCIPFLNILIQNMNKEMHERILALMLLLFVLMPTLKLKVSFNYVIWFGILYLISSYIRLYPRKIYDNVKFWCGASIVSVLIAASSVIACSVGYERLGIKHDPYFFVSDCNKILAVVVALSLFMFFKNLKMNYHKFINVIASTTFGVLLIHASSNAMRKWLWGDLIDCAGHYDCAMMPLYALGCVIAVFCACSVIDYLRQKFLERFFLAWWDAKIDQRINRWWSNRKQT